MLGRPVQHQPACRAAGAPASAATRRSSRLTREPLTSSRHIGRQRRAQRARQRVDVAVALGAGAEAVRRQRRQRTEGVQALDAERARQRANLAMARLGVLAELGHVAEHQPASARQLGEHLERRARRARVGVVGVVDQPRAAGRRTELQPPGHRAHGGQPGGDLRQRRARGQRSGGGRRARCGRCGARRARGPPAPSRLRRTSVKRVWKPCGPTASCSPRARTSAPAPSPKLSTRARVMPRHSSAIGVVGVDDRGAAAVERGHHLAFGARHALEAAEALEVLGAGIGDQADVRARDCRQRGDLAGAIGADLDDGEALPRRAGAAASAARRGGC